MFSRFRVGNAFARKAVIVASRTPLKLQCENQVVARPERGLLLISKDDEQKATLLTPIGLGLFANQDLAMGSAFVYGGQLLTREEAVLSSSEYIYALPDGTFLDGRERLTPGNFCNHDASRANVCYQSHEGSTMTLVTTRAVQKGEELLLNYEAQCVKNAHDRYWPDADSPRFPETLAFEPERKNMLPIGSVVRFARKTASTIIVRARFGKDQYIVEEGNTLGYARGRDLLQSAPFPRKQPPCCSLPAGTRVSVTDSGKGVIAWAHNGRYTVIFKRFVEAGVRPNDVKRLAKRKRPWQGLDQAAARFKRSPLQLSARKRGRIRLSSNAIGVGTRVAWLADGVYYSGTLSRRVKNNKMVVDRDDYPNSPEKFILEPKDANEWRLNYLEWLVLGQHSGEAQKLVHLFC